MSDLLDWVLMFAAGVAVGRHSLREAAPVVKAGPVVEAAPVVVEAAPVVVEAAPVVVEAAPVIRAGPGRGFGRHPALMRVLRRLR